MDRPRFSEVLVQRRRELGLTTQQASRVLKLKEQVLIALEEGDFEAIPKSGYAQGMVSSYARYLGLDARETVELFLEDLNEYEAETNPTRASDSRSRTGQSIRLTTQRPAVDDSRRNLLPTSGGRAGDMGDFATTSSAQTRSSSVQLVNPYRRRSSVSNRYSSSYASYSDADYEEGIDSNTTVRTGRNSSIATREQPSSKGSYRDGSRTLTGDSIVRTRTREVYQDDLALRTATGYEPASSVSARRAAHKIADTERPSSSRRRSNTQRSRSSRSQTSGVNEILNFVSESRVVIGVVAIVFMLVLLFAIFMGIQSCTKKQSATTPQGVPVTTTSTNTGTIGDVGTAENTGENLSGGETGQGVENPEQGTSIEPVENPVNAEGSTTSQNLGETISIEVSVSVASGESTWLEIMADGESRIADQVLGPWSETYVITESITVQANNTSAVSVFENGQSKTFETRASGVGSITIKVPAATPQPEAEALPTADATVSE